MASAGNAVSEPAENTEPDVDAALSVRNLSHYFGERAALKDVNFSLPSSAFTVLLGPNGAGKTTLFSLITRLYNNRAGEIGVFGYDLGRKSGEALRRLGVVFQQRTLDMDLSVGQNLAYHAALHGLSRSDRRQRIEEELNRIDLADRTDEKVRNLSGGQMRRVEIARALIHRPKLLLLDEPTVGLDIASRQDLLDRVVKFCSQDGLAVLWATHLIDEVVESARVLVLHQGTIRAEGTTADLLAETGAPDLSAAFRHLTQN